MRMSQELCTETEMMDELECERRECENVMTQHYKN